MAAIEKVDVSRGDRALERQLAYMRGLAGEWAGYEDEVVRKIEEKAVRVRSVIDKVRPVRSTDRILEVGSGGT